MDEIFCLTTKSPQAQQPNTIRLKLLKSQLASLYACQKFEDTGCFERSVQGKTVYVKSNIGILADITGYGKSLVALSLVKTRPAPTNNEQTVIINSTCKGCVTFETECTDEYVPATIIVAPNKLIGQWVREAKKTNIHFDVVPVTGDDVDFSAEVIFCRASRYNYFMNNSAQGLRFHRIMIDEADSINIRCMDKPRCNYTWLVTATPEAIPYVKCTGWLKEMFGVKTAMTSFNSHSIFSLLTIRCLPSFTQSCSPIPPIRKEFIQCWTPAHIRVIKDFVPASVRNMLNAGDLVGAVRLMGGGEHSTLNIIDIITRRFDLKIDDRKVSISHAKTAISYTDGERDAKIARYQEDIKQLSANKTEFLSRLNNVNTQHCPICYDNINNLCMTPCCNGFFCHSCITDWFKTNTICPMCRSKVHMSKLIVHNPTDTVQSKQLSETVKPKAASKEDTVIRLLCNNPKESFLIFSDYDRTADLLYEKMRQADISYARLGGHAGKIRETLNGSEDGRLRALFMNARKDGAGLNMPWIKNIIIYHQLNSSTLTQVIGRTSRLGQTHSVKVWFLQYDQEYDSPPDTALFEV